MPKKTYVGVNNKAKNVPSKGCIGIANKAKKLLKGYIGDANGKAQLFWGEKVGNFWFFYKTTSGQIIEYRMVSSPPPLGTDVVVKTNSGVAFYCISLDSKGACVITFSTDSNAVAYTDTYRGYVFNPITGNVTINNEVWYYAYRDLRPNASAANITPNCAIEDSSFAAMTPVQIITNIINSRIYTNDFAEDYKAGEIYNFALGDIEKTIRKAMAIWLYKCAPYYRNEAWYQTVLNQFDSLVEELMQNVGNNNLIGIRPNFSRASVYIRCEYSSEGGTKNMKIQRSNKAHGYEYITYDSSYSYFQYNKWYRINIDRMTGTITRQSNVYSGRMDNYIGTAVTIDENSTPPSDIYVRSWNAGLSF